MVLLWHQSEEPFLVPDGTSIRLCVDKCCTSDNISDRGLFVCIPSVYQAARRRTPRKTDRQEDASHGESSTQADRQTDRQTDRRAAGRLHWLFPRLHKQLQLWNKSASSQLAQPLTAGPTWLTLQPINSDTHTQGQRLPPYSPSNERDALTLMKWAPDPLQRTFISMVAWSAYRASRTRLLMRLFPPSESTPWETQTSISVQTHDICTML